MTPAEAFVRLPLESQRAVAAALVASARHTKRVYWTKRSGVRRDPGYNYPRDVAVYEVSLWGLTSDAVTALATGIDPYVRDSRVRVVDRRDGMDGNAWPTAWDRTVNVTVCVRLVVPDRNTLTDVDYGRIGTTLVTPDAYYAATPDPYPVDSEGCSLYAAYGVGRGRSPSRPCNGRCAAVRVSERRSTYVTDDGMVQWNIDSERVCRVQPITAAELRARASARHASGYLYDYEETGT